MSKREIELAIKAIDLMIMTTGIWTAEERKALYGARDALEIELKRVRARRPA